MAFVKVWIVMPDDYGRDIFVREATGYDNPDEANAVVEKLRSQVEDNKKRAAELRRELAELDSKNPADLLKDL